MPAICGKCGKQDAAFRFGDSTVIGTGSVVLGDVPSGVIVAGNPAKIVGIKLICNDCGNETVFKTRLEKKHG